MTHQTVAALARWGCTPLNAAAGGIQPNPPANESPLRLASLLAEIGCGMMLFVGHQIVYQNLAATVQAGGGDSRPAGPDRSQVFQLGPALVIDNMLRRAYESGACQVVSLGRMPSGSTVAVVPLALGTSQECSAALVIVGSASAGDVARLHVSDSIHEAEASGFDIGNSAAQERAVLTLLFTDIVGATEHAERLGDRDWHRLLDRHHAVVRAELGRFRGREVDTAGDGFFAAFDGPARAVRCAAAIRGAVRSLGLEIRAGLHTGECDVAGSKIVGIAVHLAARVADAASAGEILVSSTVKELVGGSGLTFCGGAWRTLKGLSDEWRLFSLDSDGA